MSIFDFFRKKVKPSTQPTNNVFSIEGQYAAHETPKIKVQTQDESYEYDLKTEYVRLSTSGDGNVCPMCKQFEGKYFLSTDAPKLPLCPLCSCEYEYYDKSDLPSRAKIRNPNDFIFPADCTPLFYEVQNIVYEEKDIQKQIQMCESSMEKLPEFMFPYISAKFEVQELACRDLLPELYMRIGKWDKAKSTIERCISANAYYPKNGSVELADLESYRTVATTAIAYISENPGCLQRNIYKALAFKDNQKEQLKHFLRYSLQIEKEKFGNTNKLFCKTALSANNTNRKE